MPKVGNHVNAENRLATIYFLAYRPGMEPNIRSIVKSFGSAGKAAQATAMWLVPLKRQSLETWCVEGKFPPYRLDAVLRLKAIAEHLSPTKPARRKAK